MKTNKNAKSQKKISARLTGQSSFEGWATNHNATIIGRRSNKANIEGWATNHNQSML